MRSPPLPNNAPRHAAARPRPLALAFAATLALPLAHAQPPTTTPEVSVSATRERRSVDETTATVTVISAEEIDEGFVRDIRDLVPHEPGVTVRRAPARFGAVLGATIVG